MSFNLNKTDQIYIITIRRVENIKAEIVGNICVIFIQNHNNNSHVDNIDVTHLIYSN